MPYLEWIKSLTYLILTLQALLFDTQKLFPGSWAREYSADWAGCSKSSVIQLLACPQDCWPKDVTNVFSIRTGQRGRGEREVNNKQKQREYERM